MTNAECPWDTAIIIHCRWMGFIRWFASSPHAVWVGVRAEEEFTFCSSHLPSWVSDECFEHSVEEVLETGRSKVLGIDANCNIDDSGDRRGVLVRELCAVHNLLPLFQRFWTLLGSLQQESRGRRKLTSAFRTRNLQKLRLQKICICEVITNHFVCRDHMCRCDARV